MSPYKLFKKKGLEKTSFWVRSKVRKDLYCHFHSRLSDIVFAIVMYIFLCICLNLFWPFNSMHVFNTSRAVAALKNTFLKLRIVCTARHKMNWKQKFIVSVLYNSAQKLDMQDFIFLPFISFCGFRISFIAIKKVIFCWVHTNWYWVKDYGLQLLCQNAEHHYRWQECRLLISIVAQKL